MKVNDYVRTKYGNIGKITNLYKQFSQVEYQDNQTRCDTNENNILKSSPNIIDLIEVGDYVNGVLVESIYQREQDKLYIHSFDTEIMMCFTNNNIKSIVTKESMESVTYYVK